MALSVENTFTYKSGVFPDAVSVNSTGPTTTDGTEVIKNMIDNWLFGPQQALLSRAGLVPNEVVESASASQLISAIQRGFGVIPGVVFQWMLNDDPAIFGVRGLLLQGQGVLVATYPDLVANTYCGDTDNPTAPAFFRADDAAGTSRNTAGVYFILPETRGVSPRAIGSLLINGRNKTGPTKRGQLQEDQAQAWQLGVSEDNIGPRNYWGAIDIRDTQISGSAASGYGKTAYNTSYQGVIRKLKAMNDGTNGNPRQGLETQGSTFGTNYIILY